MEPLDDARLRRIRGKRRIEYLRKATDADRLRGDARGTGFLRSSRPSELQADTSSPHIISTGMMTPARPMRAPVPPRRFLPAIPIRYIA